MSTRVCMAIILLVAIAACTATAQAADIAILPIDLKGDPPGPFCEVYEALLWEAIHFRLGLHMGVNMTNYDRANRALNDANLAPEDLKDKPAFVKVHHELNINGYVAIHLTVKAPKPSKKKNAKPKPYIYYLNVLMYNSGGAFLIKVLKTTIKPKRVASITSMAALIEKKIVEKGRLNPKLEDKPKVAENDQAFSEFYVGHAEKASDRKVKQRCFRKALHLIPDNRKLWMQYVEMLVKAKDAQSAFTIFREAEEFFPDDANLFAYHAEVANRFGKRDEAEDALKKALKINPENFRALLLKANMLFADRKYEEAKEVYENLAKTVMLEEMRKEMERYIEKCDKKIMETGKKKE